ncbi:MAG: hypothetical protein WBM28_00305 [Burkholderiales bacterium]
MSTRASWEIETSGRGRPYCTLHVIASKRTSGGAFAELPAWTVLDSNGIIPCVHGGGANDAGSGFIGPALTDSIAALNLLHPAFAPTAKSGWQEEQAGQAAANGVASAREDGN